MNVRTILDAPRSGRLVPENDSTRNVDRDPVATARATGGNISHRKDRGTK